MSTTACFSRFRDYESDDAHYTQGDKHPEYHDSDIKLRVNTVELVCSSKEEPATICNDG